MKQGFVLVPLCTVIVTFMCAQDGYAVSELSEKEYGIVAESAFYFYGERSPDSSRWVFFPDCEEEAG